MSNTQKTHQGLEVMAMIKDTPQKQGELDRGRFFFQTLRNLLKARARPRACSLALYKTCPHPHVLWEHGTLAGEKKARFRLWT